MPLKKLSSKAKERQEDRAKLTNASAVIQNLLNKYAVDKEADLHDKNLHSLVHMIERRIKEQALEDEEEER